MKKVIVFLFFALISASASWAQVENLRTGTYATYYESDLDSGFPPTSNVIFDSMNGRWSLTDDDCELEYEEYSWQIRGKELILVNHTVMWREDCDGQWNLEPMYIQYFRILRGSTPNRLELVLYKEVIDGLSQDVEYDESDPYIWELLP